jgi:hypothetical protein
MATLKKSKFDILFKHVEEGGTVSSDIVAELLGLDPDDTATINGYIRKLNLSTPQEETKQPTVYQLRGADGILRDLDLIREKDNLFVFEFPVVKDLVDIVIKGKEVTVDMEILKGLSRDSLYNGVPVSTLLAAAELAKG